MTGATNKQELLHKIDLFDFARRAGFEPPDRFCIAYEPHNGKGFPQFELAQDRWDSSFQGNGGGWRALYLASGAFKPGTIVDSKGRTMGNVERVLFLGLDCDLKDFLKSTGRASEAKGKSNDKGGEIDGTQPFRAWPEEQLAKEIEAFRAIIAGALEKVGAPEPSTWICSGGGVYALWGLRAQDGELTRARKLNKALAVAVNEVAGFKVCDFKPDPGTRVFRIPGTWHMKNPEHPRRCDWMPGGTGAPVDLEALETALAKSSASNSKAKPSRSSEPAIQLEDREVLERIRSSQQGHAFDALWRGDTSKHGDDHSAADQALCSILAFWCGRDPGQMDRLFRASGLYRDKWERDDYRERTIQRAIEGGRDTYGSKGRNGSRRPHREEPPLPDDMPPWMDEAPFHGEEAFNQEEPDPPIIEPKGEQPIHRTELGNARRLIASYGEDLRYCYTWKSWLLWDGRRWKRDQKGAVVLRMKRIAGQMHQEAVRLMRKAQGAGNKALAASASNLQQWALKSESKQKLEASVSLACSEPGIPILPEELDQNPFLLTCKSGTVDLQRGELLAHDRKHLITKELPYPWDSKAKCPEWDSFLFRVMGGKEDPEKAKRLIGFLQRAVGYSLTGDTRERKLFFLYGKGRNGKSTFLETILEMLGDFGQNADFSSFIEQKNETVRNDLAALRGARFVYAAETKEHVVLDVGTIKNLTGRDTITARFLYQEHFSFKPQFKLWLAANHKPTIRDLTDSIWDRLMLIPFTVRIPDEEEDLQLPHRLLEELPGIFQWAVRGSIEWQKNGLKPPIEVLEATSKYREEMDPVGRFIREDCAKDPEGEISRKDLYRAFEKWCEAEGIEPWKQRTVTGKIQDHGFESKKVKGERFWAGLRLKTIIEKEIEENTEFM